MNNKHLGACYKCRSIYNNAVNEFFCPACSPEMDAKIEDINKYIEEHEDATIAEIAEKFDITQELFKKLQKKSLIKYRCRMCGEIVLEGMLCDKCKTKAIVNLSSINYEKPTLPEVKAKMHFVGSGKKRGRLSGE